MINVKKHHIRRVAVLLSLGIVLIGLSAAALQPMEHLSFDSKYYLTQQQIAFVRPGLKLNVQEITVTEDGSVSVTFHTADDRGFPLDFNGVFTPGPVRARFVPGTIPQNQYLAYTTQGQTSPITGDSAVHPSTDSGGTFEKLDDGTYRYTFATKLPPDFDPDATHSVGFFANRDLSKFDLGTEVTWQI